MLNGYVWVWGARPLEHLTEIEGHNSLLSDWPHHRSRPLGLLIKNIGGELYPVQQLVDSFWNHHFYATSSITQQNSTLVWILSRIGYVGFF